MLTKLLCVVALAALSVAGASAADVSNDKSKVTLVFDHPLPNVPGKSMKAVLVEYQPGGSSPAHTHPASAFIYATVLEGAIPPLAAMSPSASARVKARLFPAPIWPGTKAAARPASHHAPAAKRKAK